MFHSPSVICRVHKTQFYIKLNRSVVLSRWQNAIFVCIVLCNSRIFLLYVSWPGSWCSVSVSACAQVSGDQAPVWHWGGPLVSINIAINIRTPDHTLHNVINSRYLLTGSRDSGSKAHVCVPLIMKSIVSMIKSWAWFYVHQHFLGLAWWSIWHIWLS